jgi:hypothetical protein
MTFTHVWSFTIRVDAGFITNWRAIVWFFCVTDSITRMAVTDLRLQAFPINTFFRTRWYAVIGMCCITCISIVTSALVWSSAVAINTFKSTVWHTDVRIHFIFLVSFTTHTFAF